MEDKKIEDFIQEDNLELEDIYPFITPEDEEDLFQDKLLENRDEELRNDNIDEGNNNGNTFTYFDIDS